DLLVRCDAFRRPERIAPLALVCESDRRGRLGFEDAGYPQGPELQRLHAAAMAVSARVVARDGLTGTQVGAALRQARIDAIERNRRPAGPSAPGQVSGRR